MNKWKYIRDFIVAVQDKASSIHPVYRRNFRELIKIIPLLGSAIDANTVGAIENNILEDRLRNLESACERALRMKDVERLTAEIMNINSIFFVLIVTGQRDMIRETTRIADELKRLSEQNRFQMRMPIDRRFLFVTISGPSAVGKDCVLDTILSRRANIPRDMDSLTKFTNRPQRLVDSKYYDFLTDQEYDLLEQSRNIIFPYYKRGFRYGFDRTHLFSAASKSQILFSIFTHFESLPTDREYLKELGINHIAILLIADRDTLIRRSSRRLLERSDIDARNASIEHDLDFIRLNKTMVDRCFDLIIDNGDGKSIYKTCGEVVHKIGLRDPIFENATT